MNVAISLYYYPMVVKRMYLEPPTNPSPIRLHPLTGTALALLVLGIFAIGIFQEPFLQVIASSTQP